MGIIWTIVIGVIAGAVAGWIMKGQGFGFIMNLIVGLAGSFIGGWVYSLLGISSNGGIWGTLVMSVVGAVVLLFVLSLFRKKK